MTRRRPHREPVPSSRGGDIRPRELPQGPVPPAHHPQPTRGLEPIDAREPWHSASELGDAIRSFYITGGRPAWRTAAEEAAGTAGDERLSGAQLLSQIYVPEGRIGYLKNVRAQPYFFEQLGSYDLIGDPPAFVPQPPARFSVPQVPDHFNGTWQTPIGWEARDHLGQIVATWRYGIALTKGQLPPNPVDAGLPVDFGLRDVPVPQAVYASQPFDALGAEWLASRQQLFGLVSTSSDHLILPPRTTALLIARWTQAAGPFRTECCKPRVTRRVRANSGVQILVPPATDEWLAFNTVLGNTSLTVEQLDGGGTVVFADNYNPNNGQQMAATRAIPMHPLAATVRATTGDGSDVEILFRSSTAVGLPLGPSTGLMQGYTLPDNAHVAKEAAKYGWGG